MIKAKVRATFFALSLPLLLNATHILKDDILKPEVSKIIDTIGDELLTKTGINGYVIATNEHFPVGFNLVEYSKGYSKQMVSPFVLFIFAPQAKITKVSDARGRVGLIPSSTEVKSLYDYESVINSAIGVVSVQDKNTPEDKDNIGVLQAFSELADNIASSKGVELKNTLPNETRNVVWVLKLLVYFGSLLVLWIFIIRPIYIRIKNGKQ